jgi:hypothetical protein
MDPLAALTNQRQQRYEIFSNLGQRLAQMGEERRQKAFMQDVMALGDQPVTMETIQQLSSRHPYIQPEVIFNTVGGIAKFKTAGRVKNVLSTFSDLENKRRNAKTDEEKQAIVRQAKEYKARAMAENSDIWPDITQIMQAGMPKIESRDPNNKYVSRDPVTGAEETVQDARLTQEELKYDFQTFRKERLKKNKSESAMESMDAWKAFKREDKDTESERAYQIYRERTVKAGRTPADYDVWKNTFGNPLGDDYEEFSERDFSETPEPAKPEAGGGKGVVGTVLDKVGGFLSGKPKSTEPTNLRERAIQELRSRGKATSEEAIRATMIYLKRGGM